MIPSYIERKWGREKVTYPFPELEPVLKETFGVYVYQEQLMKSAQILAGMTMGQADMIRKGVAKKKPDLMGRWIELMIYGDVEYKRIQEERITQYPSKDMLPVDEKGEPTIWVDYEEYRADNPSKRWKGIPEIEGAINRGFDLETLLEMQKEWIAFGNYCFNRAHSAAYAFLSVITAYFKCYYPVEFMAALMTIAEGKKDKNKLPKSVGYMKEAEDMGIQILPPSINESDIGWTPKQYEFPLEKDGQFYLGEIRYGLASIGGLSHETVAELLLHRPYASVDDMITRTSGVKVNKTKTVALIKSGAFDAIENNRNLLLRDYHYSRGEAYDHIPAQTSKANILEYERECFGVSISARSRWSMIEDGAKTQITGEITSIEKWKASTGKEHFTLTVNTNEEPILVTVWGYLMEKNADKLQLGNKLVFKGEKSREKLTAKQFTLKTTSPNPFEVDIEEPANTNNAYSSDYNHLFEVDFPEEYVY